MKMRGLDSRSKEYYRDKHSDVYSVDLNTYKEIDDDGLLYYDEKKETYLFAGELSTYKGEKIWMAKTDENFKNYEFLNEDEVSYLNSRVAKRYLFSEDGFYVLNYGKQRYKIELQKGKIV